MLVVVARSNEGLAVMVVSPAFDMRSASPPLRSEARESAKHTKQQEKQSKPDDIR
jgi:hypothetical protein